MNLLTSISSNGIMIKISSEKLAFGIHRTRPFVEIFNLARGVDDCILNLQQPYQLHSRTHHQKRNNYHHTTVFASTGCESDIAFVVTKKIYWSIAIMTVSAETLDFLLGEDCVVLWLGMVLRKPKQPELEPKLIWKRSRTRQV